MSRKILIMNSPSFDSGSIQQAILLEKEKQLSDFTLISKTGQPITKPEKKKRTKKSKMYFTVDTEDGIVAYCAEKDPYLKNKIYNERIKYSFEKLAENIINTFSFSYIPESYEDIKTAVISHMLINIDKYKKDKGKAFSYFSIMVKNCLIILNNQFYSELKTNYSIQAGEKNDQFEFDILDEDDEKRMKKDENAEFIKIIVEYWEKNIPFVFKKRRDMDIAQAVIELLSNVSSLEFFNKKALYLLIREMTGHKTQYITRVLTKMQMHYAGIKESYHRDGTLEETVFFRKKQKK